MEHYDKKIRELCGSLTPQERAKFGGARPPRTKDEIIEGARAMPKLKRFAKGFLKQAQDTRLALKREQALALNPFDTGYWDVIAPRAIDFDDFEDEDVEEDVVREVISLDEARQDIDDMFERLDQERMKLEDKPQTRSVAAELKRIEQEIKTDYESRDLE